MASRFYALTLCTSASAQPPDTTTPRPNHPTAHPSVYYVHRDKDTPEDLQYALTDYRRNWKKGKVARVKSGKFAVVVPTDRNSAHHPTVADNFLRGSVRIFGREFAQPTDGGLDLKSPIRVNNPTSVSFAANN